jgi:MFS family permease
VTEGASEEGRRSGWKSRRTAARLAWALYGLVLGLSIIWAGADLLSQYGSRNALYLVGEALISLAAPVVFAIVAALIVSRQPRNTMGWLLMVPVGLYVVSGPLVSYIERLAPSSPAPTVPLLLIVWFNNWNWLLLIIPLLLILLLFPNGQPPTPRWRLVGVAAIVWAALFVLMAALVQQINAGTTPNLVFDNPIGVLREDTVELMLGAWIVGLLVLAVACAVALFVRYRRVNETEREQIKWLLYACALFLVVYLGGFVSGLGGTTSLGGYIWGVFFGLSVITLPAAIGVAILRYRLYDIDVVINRTLVYGTLTAMLALVYLGGVATTQAIFRTLTSQEQQPQLAIVISTLAIAALFSPLRRSIQSFIDRRFYRRKYDARKTLETFSAKLRDETDLDALSDNLVGVVRETMQPAHVSLWLRPDTVSREGTQED